MRLQATCRNLETITGRVYAQVRGGGQGRGRTADLPLFRSKDHCLRAAMMDDYRTQWPSTASGRLQCTPVNETRNETAVAA